MFVNEHELSLPKGMIGMSKRKIDELFENNIHFISNDYFMLTNDNVAVVYKINDGERLCTLDASNLYFVRDSTAPECLNSKILGIFNINSKKLYSINLQTLLHLGAKNMCLG